MVLARERVHARDLTQELEHHARVRHDLTVALDVRQVDQRVPARELRFLPREPRSRVGVVHVGVIRAGVLAEHARGRAEAANRPVSELNLRHRARGGVLRGRARGVALSRSSGRRRPSGQRDARRRRRRARHGERRDARAMRDDQGARVRASRARTDAAWARAATARDDVLDIGLDTARVRTKDARAFRERTTDERAERAHRLS